MWSKGMFNGLGKKIAEVEYSLNLLQQREILRESCEECAKLEGLLDDLNRKHETYWYLSSRVLEVRDGDRNTSYLHNKASQKKRRNRIDSLFYGEGIWQDEDEKLEEIIGEYYKNLFTSTLPSLI